jgi:hypothetical protein
VSARSLSSGVRLAMIAAGVVGVAALVTPAGRSVAAPPKVIEIDVPEPTRPPPPPPAPVAPAQPGEPTVLPDGTVVPASMSGVGRSVRREARKVAGNAPAMLAGRYEIVQVTTDGETEDYRLKMEREGKALEQDCITVRRVFDFGPGEPPGLPDALGISEQQECYKGGLGSYANELWVILPTTWKRVEGDEPGLALELPPVEARASLVRVKQPTRDDLKTPSHWLGPESKIDREGTRYELLAEMPPGNRPGGPVAIHLIEQNVVYHLEPEPADGPFVR